MTNTLHIELKTKPTRPPVAQSTPAEQRPLNNSWTEAENSVERKRWKDIEEQARVIEVPVRAVREAAKFSHD